MLEQQQVQGEALVKCVLTYCFCSSSKKRIAAYVPIPKDFKDEINYE